MRAIISVSNKTGAVSFANTLAKQGIDIYSTGGTKKAIAEGGVQVRSISDITEFPEILGGRVKTLHPAIHGGILARRDLPAHYAQMKDHGIDYIDLVAVNLYPFVETISNDDVDIIDALENIDIGGPTMIRAAAKNFLNVIVVVDPADYDMVADRVSSNSIDDDFRKKLAQKAFQHVALYDTAIARYLSDDKEILPDELSFSMLKMQKLRYGENPHQQGALYTDDLAQNYGVAGADQIWGKELSFNNIADSNAAWEVVSDFDEPTVAIIKHTNPCGLASNENLTEAYRRALAGDPVSAFGGILACNRILTHTVAEEIAKVFYEIVIAPGFQPEALNVLKSRKNLRILIINPQSSKNYPTLEYRKISGGLLVQTADTVKEDPTTWECVTTRRPTSSEWEDLSLAWIVAKHIKSNAIVLTKNKMLVGMGAGQPNRVTSVHLALRSAGDRAFGSTLASDAFFPFADNVELAANGGVKALIQPGGSVRDEEVIATANRLNVSMVFTGIRHFRH